MSNFNTVPHGGSHGTVWNPTTNEYIIRDNFGGTGQTTGNHYNNP